MRRAAPGIDRGLLLAIGGAWILVVALEAAGLSGSLHHGRIGEAGRSLWVSLLPLLAGWQLMITATMLPALVPTLRYVSASSFASRRGRAVSLFLAGYLGVWSVFGAAAIAGDAALHAAVGARPAPSIPWTIAGILLLAAGWQFTPLKRRCIRATRGLPLLPVGGRGSNLATLRLGLRSGVSCVGSCWALMLVMFATGTVALSWMLFLALVVLVEKTMPHGHRSARPVGVMVALLAAIGLAIPSVLASG